MISSSIQAAILELLQAPDTAPVSINRIQSVGGGSIHAAYRLDTSIGLYFAKVNDTNRFPGIFETEAKGLELLRSTEAISIPEVVATGEAGGESFLLLHFVEAAARTANFWEAFGANLAALHRNTDAEFGLDHANYIGSLPQTNTPCSSWEEFFAVHRLEAQLRPARDQGLIDSNLARLFDRLLGDLAAVFPQEPAALIHGDLWSGNFMTGSDGEAWIFDPAVYYGHREMDLGMSRLFGGFSASFYEAYDRAYSLEAGWEERVPVANLYPLLVHVNLFGSSYVYQVEQVLRKFA